MSGMMMAKKNADDDLDLGIETEKGSKKKLIILIAVGLLVLLGGGLSVGWFLFGGDDEQDGVAEEVQQETETEIEKLPAIYHPLDPLFVVNLPPGGKARMLQVGVQVMARKPELIEFIQHNDPMIRHDLLNLFSSQEGEKLSSRKGKEKLQAEVLKNLNRIVQDQEAPGEIEGVYFTSFVMQ